VEELTVPAAKKRPAKKKRAVKQKPMTFEAALTALGGPPRHIRFVGGLDTAGQIQLDPTELEALKKKLQALGISWDKVKFVAMNAPFMRRSPIA
jgi:hypothetical protein